MTTWISGRISGLDFVLLIGYSSTFSRFFCLYRTQMRDYSKTCLATVLIRSILRWKNCTCAEALVPFSRAKIERINKVARHVVIHTLSQWNALWYVTHTADYHHVQCVFDVKAIPSLLDPISRLRDFTRSCGKTSVRLVNRGPGNIFIESDDLNQPWI